MSVDFSLASHTATAASGTYFDKLTLARSTRVAASVSSLILLSFFSAPVHRLMEESRVLRKASEGRSGERFAARASLRTAAAVTAAA